ncbi:hypothetical protein Lal_00015946 [Lupinus albus]|uniref:Uncharacterized protein n=1 Tax=Lupinus albus TaxID=3870 RepID=A0A6A4QKC8_LUPAL|nr:hypothetical protein Lalb_Chr05g0219611 [Lupinus albus]KAF1872846.1 hypothetical protein Lal_00015946 [Lupinus albus]
MIGYRERERTRENRRLSWAKPANFFLWVILVFALISLFLSIHNESIYSSSRRNLTIKPPTPLPHRENSFRKTLFHSSSTSSSKISTTATQARFVSTNIVDPNNTLYGDDKRIIHTGPNPLHN